MLAIVTPASVRFEVYCAILQSIEEGQSPVVAFRLASQLAPYRGNQEAWPLIYQSWTSKLQKLLEDAGLSESDPSSSASAINEWKMLTDYLSAMGAAVPKSLESQAGSPQYVKSFIARVVGILLDESVPLSIKNAAISAFSTELHENFGPELIDQFEQFLKTTTEKNPSPALIVSQYALIRRVLGILEALFKRAEASNFELLESVDVHTMLKGVASFLQNHPGVDEDVATSRVLYCRILSIIIQNRQNLTFSDEMTLRNRLVDIIIPWIRVSFDDADLSSHAINQCDVSVASFEALSRVLLNMPLVDVDKEEDSNAV
jgi:hypothetical protein